MPQIERYVKVSIVMFTNCGIVYIAHTFSVFKYLIGLYICSASGSQKKSLSSAHLLAGFMSEL